MRCSANGAQSRDCLAQSCSRGLSQTGTRRLRYRPPPDQDVDPRLWRCAPWQLACDKRDVLVAELGERDLEAAVNAATFGAFANSGQICMSTERIVVDESIADAFVNKLAARAVGLPLGDPRKGPVVLGSVVDASTVQRCNALIDDALAKGAKLACGGKAESTLMPATLLDHVTPDMRIYHEESFGPVKPIVRVKGVDEAVRVANDNAYGLSAAVFGRDIARAWQVAGRIESGICHVNGPTVHDEAQMPFGGVKDSGYGRFGGKAGIDAFTELRWVTVQTTERHYPF